MPTKERRAQVLAAMRLAGHPVTAGFIANACAISIHWARRVLADLIEAKEVALAPAQPTGARGRIPQRYRVITKGAEW